MLPHSLDLERDVLNAALEWGRVAPELTPDLFFRDANAVVWRAVQQAVSQGLTPQQPIVRQILTERGELDIVGSVWTAVWLEDPPPPAESEAVSVPDDIAELGRNDRVGIWRRGEQQIESSCSHAKSLISKGWTFAGLADEARRRAVAEARPHPAAQAPAKTDTPKRK